MKALNLLAWIARENTPPKALDAVPAKRSSSGGPRLLLEPRLSEKPVSLTVPPPV